MNYHQKTNAPPVRAPVIVQDVMASGVCIATIAGVRQIVMTATGQTSARIATEIDDGTRK